MNTIARSALAVGVALMIPAAFAAQTKATKPVVTKIRDGVYRVGANQVDTNKKELSVPGFVNSDVTTLEFVANTQGGAKAYESAVTLSTDAVTFNAALLLLGLDPAHARAPKQHFDTAAPKGDPLEIWIEWKLGDSVRRVRIEELLYDERAKKTIPEGPWVYTGSTFSGGRYMADVDGVLIGFVHSPAPVIENPRSGAVNAYGSVVLNKKLPLPKGVGITMIIKALPITKSAQ